MLTERGNEPGFPLKYHRNWFRFIGSLHPTFPTYRTDGSKESPHPLTPRISDGSPTVDGCELLSHHLETVAETILRYLHGESSEQISWHGRPFWSIWSKQIEGLFFSCFNQLSDLLFPNQGTPMLLGWCEMEFAKPSSVWPPADFGPGVGPTVDGRNPAPL